ncbi:MAG: M14 family zinc carboxypeptidase [Armatimonadota bacterium]
MSTIPDVKFDSWYTWDELTTFLQSCHRAADDLMQLESLVTSPEGRDVWLATLTDPATGAAEDKPAYFVQGNLHAHEMYGTSAVLHLLHSLLTSDEGRERLSELTFYIIPRSNPDGAEYAISTKGEVRSRVVPDEKLNGVIPQDLNDDGMILNMRWEDPAGPLAVDPEDQRLLVPRRPGDTGPFYHQCTEGLVHEYDGGPLRDSVEHQDFNRNYPIGWDHRTDRANYPFEQPEVRAIADFMFAKPNIFAGVDFHGGTPAILHPDNTAHQELNEADRGLILEIGEVGEQLSGLKLMSGRDYRASWRKPLTLPGSSKDFAHYGLGISFYTIEVGFGYSTAGIGPDESFDAPPETKERDFMRRIMRFGDEHADTDSRVLFVPWEDHDHPQLGAVQIGGLVRRDAISHVYPPEMEGISAGTSRFVLRHATYHPRIELSGCEATAVGPDLYRVRARVANTGYLATNVMSTGMDARVHEPVRASLDEAEGVEVLSRRRIFEFPALAGRGAFEPLEWFVSAPSGGELTVRAQHPRGGVCTATLTLS